MNVDNDCQIVSVEWGISKEVSNHCHVPENIAAKVIELLSKGDTVPFISRYRKETTKGLQPDVLYSIKKKSDQLKLVQEQVRKSMAKLSVGGMLDKEVKKNLARCKSVEEVAMIVSFLFQPLTICLLDGAV